MNWEKPTYNLKRFGFEVTMYIYTQPLLNETDSDIKNEERAYAYVNAK